MLSVSFAPSLAAATPSINYLSAFTPVLLPLSPLLSKIAAFSFFRLSSATRTGPRNILNKAIIPGMTGFDGLSNNRIVFPLPALSFYSFSV